MGARLTPVHDQHRNSSTVVVVMVGSSRIEIKEAMVAVEVGLVCVYVRVCARICAYVDTWMYSG